MLVDEWSTSVYSVKKGPPFSIMKAGNANRTKSKRRSDPYGREKFITYEMELQISHSIGTEISEKSNIQEIEKRHRENTENLVRLQTCGNSPTKTSVTTSFT